MSKSFIALDVFAGCGGLTEGLKQAGFKVLGSIELDAKASQTYRLNHPEVDLIEADIRNIAADDLLKRWKISKGDLDLLAGCPPCQGFSTLRTRNRKTSRDARNSLIDEFTRLVVELSPKAVMLENVPGLEKHHRFKKFLVMLAKKGYHYIYKSLNVADYGVAQRRSRLILLACKSEAPSFANKLDKKVTVADIIADMPSPDTCDDEIHAIPECRSNRVREIIKAIPKNGGSRRDLPEHLVLKCHISFSGFSDVYGRMRWDDQSPTITSGCHNPSKGRFIHPEQDRTITLREASLLQGFPRSYSFVKAHGKESLALMIGNALPPPFIKVHAREVIKAITND